MDRFRNNKTLLHSDFVLVTEYFAERKSKIFNVNDNAFNSKKKSKTLEFA